MSFLKTVDDERVVRFVSAMVGRGLFPPFTTLGIERRGEVVGGVIFNCFTGADVHVTVAGKGWTAGFMGEVGDYVFRQLGCSRMTAITEQPRVAFIAQRLGGRVEGTLRDYFGPGRDAQIIGILKQEYAF